MEKFKNNKLIYSIICIITIIICLIIYIANKNDNDTYIIENNVLNNSLLKENKSEENKKEEKEIIFIHIIGEVNKPGVVEVKKGSRIKDVIEQAGGLTENADIEKVNLVYEVSDGQKINIPNKNDIKENELKENNYISTENGSNIIIEEKNKENKKVNINTATQTELETITGIGPSTASKIIKYRFENGKFKNISDIKNVSGIGEAKFNSIKDEITV